MNPIDKDHIRDLKNMQTWAIGYAANFHRFLQSLKKKNSNKFKVAQKLVLKFKNCVHDELWKSVFSLLICDPDKNSSSHRVQAEYNNLMALYDSQKP